MNIIEKIKEKVDRVFRPGSHYDAAVAGILESVLAGIESVTDSDIYAAGANRKSKKPKKVEPSSTAPTQADQQPQSEAA